MKGQDRDGLRRVCAGAANIHRRRERRRCSSSTSRRRTTSPFQRALLAARYDTHSQIPSLDKALVREYPGWTQEVPDVVKAGDISAHLREWETARQHAESRE